MKALRSDKLHTTKFIAVTGAQGTSEHIEVYREDHGDVSPEKLFHALRCFNSSASTVPDRWCVGYSSVEGGTKARVGSCETGAWRAAAANGPKLLSSCKVPSLLSSRPSDQTALEKASAEPGRADIRMEGQGETLNQNLFPGYTGGARPSG